MWISERQSVIAVLIIGLTQLQVYPKETMMHKQVKWKYYDHELTTNFFSL